MILDLCSQSSTSLNNSHISKTHLVFLSPLLVRYSLTFDLAKASGDFWFSGLLLWNPWNMLQCISQQVLPRKKSGLKKCAVVSIHDISTYNREFNFLVRRHYIHYIHVPI